MKSLSVHVGTIAVVIVLVISTVQAEPTGWMAFRGDGSGAAKSGPQTLEMAAATEDGKESDASSQGNLVWQAPMPGRSVAAPIVVGDLVISTSSSGPDEMNLYVTACDLTSGNVRWQQSFRATGRPFHHPTSAVAAPTPVSDGKRIVAFYSSNDLICLSLQGDLLWYRGLGVDYPKAGNDIGMASSPVIVDDAVVVQVECQGDSFAAAIEMETGKNRWRIARPPASNWASPTVIKRSNEKYQVVLQSREDVVAVDPENGTELWRLDEGRASIPSPTHANGILLLPGGDDLLAMRIDSEIANGVEINEATANSNVGEPSTLWRQDKLSPRNGCVAIEGERIYSLKGSILIAASLETGDTIWKERLSGISGTWASPSIANGHLYIFDQTGAGVLVKDQGDHADIISKVQLEEGVLGSPAIARGRLVVRSQTQLYCFE